jgi:5'-nucleotidase
MAIKKFTLLIDMDGVIAQWYPGLLSKYQEKFPDRPVVEPKDVTQFYVEGLYPEEHREDILATARERGFYLSLPVMPGAQAALKDIEDNCLDFINPFICTAPELEFEDLMCHSEKAQYLREHFGDFWVKQAIITKDKTVVRGDALIDDKPNIKGSMDPLWGQIVYAQPYNDGEFTWEDWPEIRELIREHTWI